MWLSVTLFVAVGAGIYGVFLFLAEQPRFFRSPTLALVSDGEWHDSVLNPATRASVPDLLSHPAPETPVVTDPPGSSNPDEVIVSCMNPEFPTTYELAEVFAADKLGVVALPDGNQLSLSAVAVFLPTDADWDFEEEPSDQVPNWIYPVTGDQLVFPPDAPEWTKPRSLPTTRPRLHFRVEVKGEAPIRWRVPVIHDARTRRSIGGAVPGSTVHGDGFFSMDLKTWHQTPLDLGIDFAFGDPVLKTLPIQKDAELRFGDEAMIRVVNVFPSGFRYLRFKERETIFNLYTKPQPTRKTALALLIWPPQQAKQIEFQPIQNEEPLQVFASRGMGALKWTCPEKENTEVTVSRYPRMGRAVFHLPTIPRLPDVDNLFEAPISKIRVKYPSNFVRYAAEAAEVKPDFSFKLSDLSDAKFPLLLTDTTPQQIVSEFEAMSGIRLYYDRKAGLLSDRKPPSLLERLEDWWRNRRPGWIF